MKKEGIKMLCLMQWCKYHWKWDTTNEVNTLGRDWWKRLSGLKIKYFCISSEGYFPFPETPFLIEGSKLHNRNRSDKNQSGYFCSKTCSGKYGKLIQLGLINPKEKVDRIKPKKYRGKSAPEET